MKMKIICVLYILLCYINTHEEEKPSDELYMYMEKGDILKMKTRTEIRILKNFIFFFSFRWDSFTEEEWNKNNIYSIVQYFSNIVCEKKRKVE